MMYQTNENDKEHMSPELLKVVSVDEALEKLFKNYKVQ
jgi:hypothetical protein